MTNVPEKADT